MTTSKNVVFDVVSTLVGYEKMFEAIDTRLGDRLRADGIKPTLLGYCWIEVAEREYTYLSMSGLYKPYAEVFESIFWRMLHKAGIEEARSFADEDDLACIMEGDLKRVGRYFINGGIDMPAENLLSCDTSALGKPDPEAYRPLFKRLSGDGTQTPWFAAGHMWEVSAAKRTGFRGAYCSIWEHEPLTELFGEMDVLSDTLPELADKIIASSE